jgi:hypothetical protein
MHVQHQSGGISAELVGATRSSSTVVVRARLIGEAALTIIIATVRLPAALYLARAVLFRWMKGTQRCDFLPTRFFWCCFSF